VLARTPSGLNCSVSARCDGRLPTWMRLNRYIFWQLLTALLFAAGGMLFIAVPGIAVGAVHKLAGVGTLTVLKYLPMAAAKFVPYELPIAFLLALVSTYGRLAQDNEWTAIRMAGINPYRMLTPALLLGLLVSGTIYIMNAEALPWLDHKQKAFRVEALRSVVKNLVPGRTELQHDDFCLVAPYREGDVFFDAFIELPGDGEAKEPRVLAADEVRFEFTETEMLVHLRGVEGVLGTAVGNQETMTVTVLLDHIVGTADRDYSGARYLNTAGLIRTLRKDLPPEQRRLFELEFHKRAANSLAGLVFVLLGVSTGLLMRRGTQLAALSVSVGYALVYWILSLRLGKEMARAGTIEPWIGAWGPLILCAIAGVILMRKAFRQ